MPVEVKRLEQCTDCRSCILACSFHHLRVFAPTRASLSVTRDEATNEISLNVFSKPHGTHMACDDCSGEQGKLCTLFCPREVLV